MMTNNVATSIQAVSPLLATGAEAAAAGAEAASAGADAAGAAAAGADAAVACANDVPARPSKARPSVMEAMSFLMLMVFVLCGLQRVLAGLAGADANHLFERGDEDLSVADLAGACRGLDRLDHAFDDRVVDGRFDLHLGQEVHHVLGAAVQLGVALLAPEPLDLGHRDALHADRAERFTHFVELERLDDRGHHLHETSSGECWAETRSLGGTVSGGLHALAQ